MSHPLHIPLIPPPIQIPVDEPTTHAAHAAQAAHAVNPLPLVSLSLSLSLASPSTYDFPTLQPYEYERCLFCSILIRPSRVSSDPHVCISCLFFATTFGKQEPLHCDICCRPAWRIHTMCRTVLCRWCLPHWPRCPTCRLPTEE
jgi:hypothetical protein